MVSNDKPNSLKKALSDIYIDFTSHWRRPGKGNQVSYREIINYSVGGMGRDMVMYAASYLTLTVGSLFLGSTIGIRPMHIQYMAWILQIVQMVFIFIRGYCFDNMRSKVGKFKPFIFVSAIPLIIMVTIFYFLDFEMMKYNDKLIAIIAFVLACEFVKAFLTDAFVGIGQVMTSNTGERAKVLTFYSIIFSLAPTIYGFLVPILSDLTGGLTNINTYRYIVLPIGFLGIFLLCFTVFGTKERIITPKNYVQKINVFKGMKEVYRNKYWWIKDIAAWVGFLETAFANVFMWMYIYGVQDMTQYSLVSTLLGFAATIAMLLTPPLLKKIGNKKLLIIHNTMNIFLIFGLFATFNIPIIFVMILFTNNLFNFFTLVYNPVIDAEIRDYQHYLSGKRIDGCFSAASIINIPIIMATGFVIPFMYEAFGMTINYNVLYDPSIRQSVFSVLLAMSIVGAIMNLVPFFFYDFPREKHVNIIRVISYRALLEDFSEDCLTSERIKKGVEDYRDAVAEDEMPMPNLKEFKARVAEIKKTIANTDEEKSNKAVALKKARKEYSNAKVMKRQKEELPLYFNELNKFDKIENKLLLSIAEYVTATPIEEIGSISKINFVQSIQSEIGNFVRDNPMTPSKVFLKTVKSIEKKAGRLIDKINKKYPKGIVKPDKAELDRVQGMPFSTKEEAKLRNVAVKAEIAKHKRYSEASEFYGECELLVNSKYGRDHFDEILELYDNAAEEVEKKIAEEIAQADRIKQEKKELLEKLRQERFAKLPPQKQEKILEKKEKKQALKTKRKMNSETKKNLEDNLEKDLKDEFEETIVEIDEKNTENREDK